MAKFKIKKGDLVRVVAGNSKYSKPNEGKVLVINTKKNTAVVEGLNKAKRHTKPNAKHPNGGIVEQEAPIHISNLVLVDAAARTSKKEEKK